MNPPPPRRQAAKTRTGRMVEQRRGIADHASRTARRLRGSAYRTRFRCLDAEATPWTTHNPALGSSSYATTPLFRPTRSPLSWIIAWCRIDQRKCLARIWAGEIRGINEEGIVSSDEAGFEKKRTGETHVDTAEHSRCWRVEDVFEFDVSMQCEGSIYD